MYPVYIPNQFWVGPYLTEDSYIMEMDPEYSSVKWVTLIPTIPFPKFIGFCTVFLEKEQTLVMSPQDTQNQRRTIQSWEQFGKQVSKFGS